MPGWFDPFLYPDLSDEANGAIAWQTGFRSLVLDESHYLQQASPDLFNFGPNNFRATILIKPDSTIANPGQDRELLTKGVLPLADNAGWRFYYNPTTGAVMFEINDGQATSVVVASAAGQLLNDLDSVAVVEVNRQGNADIYVNGDQVASGDITARNGSVNNAVSLQCAGDTYNAIKAQLGYVRLDGADGSPCLYGANYAREEYWQLLYGCLRQPSAQAGISAWGMGGTLNDFIGDRPFEYVGGGNPVFVPGWPETVAYTFQKNYEQTYEIDYLALDKIFRGRYDIGKISKGADKLRAHLPFALMNVEQKIALQGAWATGRQGLYFYKAANRPLTFFGRISQSLNLRETVTGKWAAELNLEEN